MRVARRGQRGPGLSHLQNVKTVKTSKAKMTVENVWRRNVELGLNIKTYHTTPRSLVLGGQKGDGNYRFCKFWQYILPNFDKRGRNTTLSPYCSNIGDRSYTRFPETRKGGGGGGGGGGRNGGEYVVTFIYWVLFIILDMMPRIQI